MTEPLSIAGPGAEPLLFDERYHGKPAWVATWVALEQFSSRQQG